jgi:hypothetical protein
MIRFFCALLLFISFNSFHYSQGNRPKESIKVGLSIEDIYNIDYSASTFDIVFWIWVNSKNERYDIDKYMDIIGSTEVKYTSIYEDTLSSGDFHSERKVTAKILNKFDVNHFPFDEVKLQLYLEFFKETSEKINVEFDYSESNLKPDYLGSDNNKFEIIKPIISKKFYKSNYGNTDIGMNVTYPEIKIPLVLERDKWNIFAKIFITLFIAFILSSSSILLPLSMSEEKFGLIVGSLFTSIGNKYITDEMLPVSSNFNLSDRIHMLTFIFITIIALFSIFEQRYKIQLSKKFDFVLFFSTLAFYLSFVFFACIL